MEDLTMSNDLENFLKSVATAVQLLRDELSAVSTLRAEMDIIRAEHKQTNEVLQNYGRSVQEFSEIAFDENKFTQALMDKVEEVARETAKEEIDLDEIASEVPSYLNIDEEVERAINRMELPDADKVNDMVEEYVNDNNLMTSNEVDNSIEDYLANNDYLTRDEAENVVEEYMRYNDYLTHDAVKDVVRDVVNEIVDERTENVARRIVKEELVKLVHQMMHAVVGTNKLMGKEPSHDITVTNGTQPQQPNA
jgi:sulfur relay (sulfurtransferase) DsrC/TusE family protein